MAQLKNRPNNCLESAISCVILCFCGLELQMKKFLNNRHSTEADFQVKCLEHLEHDFMVQQYLRETTSVHNHQSYVNLLNQIAFNNKHKQRQIKYLTHQTRCYTAQSEEPKMAASTEPKGARWRELADFEKKIIEQEEVKNHLLIQLTQVSKSINLMKGDVTRIVEKNESTIVLEKKTSKVKLVAQDQLKKVSLALQKDHSEILERNNMQIRFNKKLKNICNNENSVLKKIQSEYLRLEKRKEHINDKIRKMGDIMKNLNEREKTKQEIKIINERNRINLEQILNLFDLVKKIQAEDEGRQDICEEKDENLIDTHLSLKTQRFKIKIKQTEAQIVKFISETIQSVQKTEKQFRCCTERVSEYKNKLEQLNREQSSYEQFILNGKKSIITQEQKRNYDQKLVQFKKSLNLLLIVWQFIQNHQNFTHFIDELKSQDLRSSKRESFPSRFYRKSEQFQKNVSVVNQENNYSNKFTKLLLFLSGNGQEINLDSEFIIKSLEMTIAMWLKGLKNIILEEEQLQQSDSLKKARSFQGFRFKSTVELMEEMAEANIKKYRLSMGQEEEDKLKTMLELISPKKSTMLQPENERTNVHTHKQVKTQGNQQCRAKRIKILEKVDYDYYKMLKNVLQIEKENIKKNYDFNKNFNRAKFTEKNIIQEQKRFQSNFALQFIKKNEQSMIIESRRSIASKASCNQQVRKRRQFHHKTELFNSFKAESSRNINKNKIRQSIFNANKLQRRSKLIERHSIDSSHNKQGRTSVLLCKRAMINFADNTQHEQY